MKLLESACRIALVVPIFILWLAMAFLPTLAKANDNKPAGNNSSASASSNASSTSGASTANVGGDSNRAYGLGSGSPSGNACQGVILFGFSYSIETCQRQMWAAVLGDKPTDAQLQIACGDPLLEDLRMCDGHRKPKPVAPPMSPFPR